MKRQQLGGDGRQRLPFVAESAVRGGIAFFPMTVVNFILALATRGD